MKDINQIAEELVKNNFIKYNQVTRRYDRVNIELDENQLIYGKYGDSEERLPIGLRKNIKPIQPVFIYEESLQKAKELVTKQVAINDCDWHGVYLGEEDNDLQSWDYTLEEMARFNNIVRGTLKELTNEFG